MSVLNCFYDSVSQILRKNVEKRIVLENLDIVMLAMDEICDGGFVFIVFIFSKLNCLKSVDKKKSIFDPKLAKNLHGDESLPKCLPFTCVSSVMKCCNLLIIICNY